MPRWKKVLFSLLPVVMLFVVMELTFRLVRVDELFGVKPSLPVWTQYADFHPMPFADLENTLYEIDVDRMYRLRAGASFTAPNSFAPPHPWRITINDDGLRQ